MTIDQNIEKNAWTQTLELMGTHHFELGNQWSKTFLNDPEKLGFQLSYYKTAAKMVGENRSILELGCGEGLGGVILGEQAVRYLGVDPSAVDIETAKKNISKDHIAYVAGSLDGTAYGVFDGVVSLYADSAILSMAVSNLDERGVCVLGSLTDPKFEEEIKAYFHHVFSFGMNDEVICTGPTDYVLYVACFKRGKQ